MEEILKNISPKSLHQVLKAYVETWQLASSGEEYKTPLISLYLLQGSIVSGEVINIDLEKESLRIRLMSKDNRIDVAYVDFKYIQAFSLHSLDVCGKFVEELAKIK